MEKFATQDILFAAETLVTSDESLSRERILQQVQQVNNFTEAEIASLEK